MSGHTPGPWKTSPGGYIGGVDRNVCRMIERLTPSGIDHEAEANAAYIVKCVNAHEALMDAVQYVLRADRQGYNSLSLPSQARLDAAIRLAEGGGS